MHVVSAKKNFAFAGEDVKEEIKKVLPDLKSYKAILKYFWKSLFLYSYPKTLYVQVTCYWTRSEVGVEMKATKFMAKKEAQL